jgi:flagellar biosynthesis protein FlhG
MTFNGQSYYEILEINEDATLQEVERAYLNAKETYSSNSSALYSMFSKEEALELHKLIEEAYNTLSNNSLRQAYDNENINLSFDDDDNDDFLEIEEPAVDHKKDEVKMVGGCIKGQFKEDSTIEDKILSLDDCSGSFLQKIRTYKNIPLEDLSKFSKISKTSILAVENEDFESLPAKVFVRGFVSQIAKLLGLDHSTFTKEYMANFDEKRK